MQIIFSSITLILSIILLLATFLIVTRLPKAPTIYKSLPRERKAGIVIAFCCFLYAAWHGRYMLENDLAKFQVYVWVFVPFITILMYRYLDFVFTRALGGAIVILTNHLMHDALVIHLPMRFTFAFASYALGTIGLFMIGMPWLFRNLLEKSSKSKFTCSAFAAFCLITAIIYFLAAINSF